MEMVPYTKIKNNLKYVNLDKASVRSTVTNENMEIYENMLDFKNLGFKKCHFEIASDEISNKRITKKNLDKIKEEYLKILNYMFENYDKQEIKFSYLLENLKKFDVQNNLFYSCSAAKTYFTINYNGDIYACHRFAGVENQILGNIFSEFDKEKLSIYTKASVQNKLTCSKCWIRYLCGGVCYHEAYIANNDLNDPPHEKCVMKRELYEFFMEQYIKFKKDEKFSIIMNSENYV